MGYEKSDMKKLFIFCIVTFSVSISLLSSDNNFSWHELVTSLVITSDCYARSQPVLEELQQRHVVRRVYRGIVNSEYVTVEFAENWVKNFRRMRAKELELYRAEIVRLLEKQVDDQSIQIYRGIIRQRKEEGKETFQEFLIRYQGDFEKLKCDIDRTERNLLGISY